MTLEELQNAVFNDLKTELKTDADYNENVLASKVAQAVREVMAARRYPSYYLEEAIAADMERFYSNVYKLALYDYNQIGIDFQTGHNENGINRSFSDRSKLFYGVIPIAVV